MRRLALVLLLAVAATGCGKQSFQRDLEVRFNPAKGSTRPDPAQVLAVRKACPGTATVILQPAGSTAKLVQALTPIHYDARKANDQQVQAVSSCVEAMPGVASVALEAEDY